MDVSDTPSLKYKDNNGTSFNEGLYLKVLKQTH